MGKKEYKNHLYRNYFFWHYVIRFLFIGILTAGMLIPSYYIMVNSMKKNEVDSLDFNMEERFQKLNGTLMALEKQARLASNEISVMQIGMARELSDESGRDQYVLSQARKWFNSSISKDDLLANAYMLSRNNTAFVSRNLVTTNEEEIYGSFYEVEGYSRDEWRDTILKSYENYAFLPCAMANGTFSPTMLEYKEPIIHMIVPISDYGIKSNQAMVYMLNVERLLHDLSPMLNGNYLFLEDKEGNILAARGMDGTIMKELPDGMLQDGTRQLDETKAEGEDMEILRSENQITGLQVVCYVPQQYFREILKPVQRMAVTMGGGILFLVAVLSFFMAIRHSNSESRTIRMIEKIYPEIMEKGREGKKKKKAFGDYVLGTIRMLDEKQRDYDERLNMMKSSLEEALLEKIVHGEAGTEREIENCREVLGIKNDYFLSIYLKIVIRGGENLKISKQQRIRWKTIPQKSIKWFDRLYWI